MLFNSWQFRIFLPVILILYFVLPKKVRHYALLVASYFFYMYWNWELVFLILGTTLVSYLAGLLIPKAQKKGWKIFFMVTAILISVGVLVFFKYFDFMMNSVADIINMFGGNTKWNSLNLILPVGISFYTFQTLSYVIDIYKGKIEPEKDFSYYALYVSFFPQLVAGPIERPENLLPQLKKEEGVNVNNLQEGLLLVLIGFVKKIVIADMVGIFVNNIFNNLEAANGLVVLIGTGLFTMQIFCDFSGYSDIAKGVAKMFNIDLMVNFNHPYYSRSIKEFWTRWHISLSSWLRDYIYFPMGGNRKGKVRWAINILVVFLISGIWHGANWTFVIWGLMHAVLQILEGIFHPLEQKVFTKHGWNYEAKWLNILRTIFTYVFVSLTWVAFRSNNISDMLLAYKLIFTGWSNINVTSFIPITFFNIVLFVVAVPLFVTIEYLPRLRNLSFHGSSIFRKGVYVALMMLVVGAYIYLEGQDIGTSFIYFQF